MNVIIRLAEKCDLPQILRIVNYEILNSTSIYDYEVHTLNWIENWFEQKHSDNMPIIIAELNKEVMAYGTFGIFRPKEAYKYCVEHSIYVSNESRGLGIGKLIMEKLIFLAKQQNYHSMIAGIDGSNKKSCDFHKQFGFEEVGLLKEVGYKFDKWLDLIFMQLLLKEERL